MDASLNLEEGIHFVFLRILSKCFCEHKKFLGSPNRGIFMLFTYLDAQTES